MIDSRATIGFEAEWVDGVDALLQGLCHHGLLSDEHLHRYHCDCAWCTDLTGTVLRAQRDSTVGGELISGILHPVGITAHQLTNLTNTIEAVAFEADATPGRDAGFHVHARVRNQRMSDMLTEYTGPLVGAALMCMPILTQHFGTGRHHGLGTMNQSTIDLARLHWQRVSTEDFPSLARVGRTLRSLGESNATDRVWSAWFSYLVHSDRHAHVAWITRYQTVEFRFWRSTRMAWRMQLFCMLSALLVSPQFHRAVLTRHGPRTSDATLADPGWLYELLDGAEGVPSDLVPLMREQQEYVEWTRHNPVPVDYTSA